MDPKEFSWTEDQQVTVKNPTKEDFNFKVHSKDYVVKAGKTVKMPGYIAWVYVYHIACQLAQNTNVRVDENKNKISEYIRWNEEGFRQSYFEKFVVGTEALVQEVIEEPEIEFDEVDDEGELDKEEVSNTPAVKPLRRKRRSNKK